MTAEPGTRASLERLFSLSGKVAVVTGATGVLGGAMARELARVGARVGVLGRREERAEAVVREILGSGGEAMPVLADVLNEERLRAAREAVLDRWGRMDILVNAAGGNVPGATLSDNRAIFDLPREAFGEVFDLNLIGALLVNEDGSLTERGRAIIEHTPVGRFGEPEELTGTVIWLCSPAANFVNGVVVPVDGGFSAFSGV